VPKLKESKSDKKTEEKEEEEVRPDPEVSATPIARRRTFSAKYKLKILKEIDHRLEWGQEIGSVLRREGLFSAHISKWRKARDQGLLQALEPKKRGRKPDPDAELRQQLKQAQAENAKLRKELEQAELIIDVQKKLSRLLGLDEEK
jgi:transposase